LIGEYLIGAVMGVREPVAMEIPLEEGAVNADIERRAALKERTAKSLVQKATSDSKHTEQVRSAILRKRAAAEKKRLALLYSASYLICYLIETGEEEES
jgi:hypothetical protein